MSFPKRILTYVIIDLLVINLVVFYWHAHLSLRLTLGAAVVEIVALTVALLYWVPKYGLKW